MADSFQRIVIADFDLRSFEGHYFHYVQSLRLEILGRGLACSVLANASASSVIAERLDALPLFRLRTMEESSRLRFEKMVYWTCCRLFPLCGLGRRLPGLRNRLRAWATFRAHERILVEDLRRSEQAVPYDARTLVFFHTLHAAQIAPILRWWKGFPRERRPEVAILLRFDPFAESKLPIRHPDEVGRSFTLLRQAGPGVHLLTDSAMLRADYEKAWGLPLRVVPIPHAASPFHPQSRVAGPVRFGYLGDARPSKGFPLLPGLIEALAGPIAAGKAAFRCQVFLPTSDEVSLAAARRLERLPVSIVPGILDDEAYFRFLGELDVVLLPYDLAYYRSQTSGVFTEALAAGKIVVVPQGSWMAEQLREHGSGVAYDPMREGALAEACVTVLERFPEFYERAQREALSWRKVHSEAQFVSILERIGEGAPAT